MEREQVETIFSNDCAHELTTPTSLKAHKESIKVLNSHVRLGQFKEKNRTKTNGNFPWICKIHLKSM